MGPQDQRIIGQISTQKLLFFCVFLEHGEEGEFLHRQQISAVKLRTEDEAVAQLFSAEGFVLPFAFMWFSYQASVFSRRSWEQRTLDLLGMQYALDLLGMQYASQRGAGGYLQMSNITPAL